MNIIRYTFETCFNKVNDSLLWLDKPLTWRTVYLVHLVFSFLFILPILLANVQFQDDFNRSSSGVGLKASSGRVGADIIARAVSLSFTGPLSDPGQLFQLLSIPVLALAAFFVMRAFINSPTSRVTIPFIFVAVNPFILTNLSYRFDSLGMIIAYAAAALAFLILARSKILFSMPRLIIAVLLLFFSTTIYQSMPNVFISLSFLYVAVEIIRNRTLLRTVMLRWLSMGLVFLTGVLLATLTMKQISPVNDPKSAFILDISRIYINFEKMLDVLASFFTLEFIILSIPIALVGLSIITVRFYSDTTNYRRMAVRITMLLGAITGIVLSLAGPLLFVFYPTMLPRSISTFFILFLIIAGAYIYSTRKSPPALVLAVAPLLVGALSFAWIYGNYIKINDEYRKQIVNNVSSDLHEINIDNKKVHIYGHLASSKLTSITTNNFPVLIYTYNLPVINQDTGDKVSYMHTYFNIALPLAEIDQPGLENLSGSDWSFNRLKAEESICNEGIAVNTHPRSAYTIYETPDSLMVWFSGARPGPCP